MRKYVSFYFPRSSVGCCCNSTRIDLLFLFRPPDYTDFTSRLPNLNLRILSDVVLHKNTNKGINYVRRRWRGSEGEYHVGHVLVTLSSILRGDTAAATTWCLICVNFSPQEAEEDILRPLPSLCDRGSISYILYCTGREWVPELIQFQIKPFELFSVLF